MRYGVPQGSVLELLPFHMLPLGDIIRKHGVRLPYYADLSSIFLKMKNASSRVLTRTRKYDHISLVLSTLALAPIKHRIHFKILLITYKALHSLALAFATSYNITL